MMVRALAFLLGVLLAASGAQAMLRHLGAGFGPPPPPSEMLLTNDAGTGFLTNGAGTGLLTR